MWYAETTGRRATQVLVDVGVLAWTVLWWWLSRVIHDLVAALGAPGRGLAGAGDRLANGFQDVADSLGGTPLVGGVLRSPFAELADAAETIGGVGTAQDAAAGALADWLSAVVLLAPVLSVGVVWLVLRVRGARRAAAARRLRDRGDLDLLALRALVERPTRQLLAVSDTPVADWRAGRTEALASLELRRLGLRSRA